MPQDYETAFTICERQGKLARGNGGAGGKYAVTLDIGCPEGFKPVGIWHCVPKDEHVYIPGKGLLLAEEAAEYAFALHHSPELVHIKTGLGGDIRVTPNHPIMTTDGWKDAGTILLTDKIMLSTELPCPQNGHIEIVDWKSARQSSVKYYPTLPKIYTKELAKLMGLIWSDGNVTEKSVNFTNTDNNLINYTDGLLGSCFNINAKQYEVKTIGKEHYSLHLNSKEVAYYFTNSLKFRKDAIPGTLWETSDEIRKAFLEGVILGDGSTSPSNPEKPGDLVTTISIGTSYSATTSLIYFLATLGIKARIRKVKQNFAKRKSDFIYQVAYQSGNHTPQTLIPSNGETKRDSDSGRFIKGHQGGNKFTGGKTNGNEVKILEIERLHGDFTVYDFHMPDYDNLLYVGSLPMITHNSHPHGVPEPSSADISEMKKLHLKHLCISVPQTGQMKCHIIK